MLKSSHQIHYNAHQHKGCSEPKRTVRRSNYWISMGSLQLTQKKPKSCDDKPETHHREPGSNPGQKRSLGCQIDAWILLR
jgi:hypothetical protein